MTDQTHRRPQPGGAGGMGVQDRSDGLKITESMVERAARALYELHLSPDEPDWDGVVHVDSSIRSLYRNEARAALEAALGDVEPLEDVLLAVQPGDYDPMKGEA